MCFCGLPQEEDRCVFVAYLKRKIGVFLFLAHLKTGKMRKPEMNKYS